MRLTLLAALAALAAPVAAPVVAHAGDVTVTITGVKDAKGSVLGAIYDSETTFMNQPQAKGAARSAAAAGKVVLVFHNLPAGRYAVAAFHDANANGKLDRNSVNVPTEGYGFSNDAQGSGGPPKFGQAAFAFDGKAKAITFGLDY